MSRRLECDPEKPEAAVLEMTAEMLNDGAVVVMPTETQYGLAVRADREGTLARICRIKGRDQTQKPALFVRDLEMAASFCRFNPTARKLANRFLPGPLTLILPTLDNQRTVASEYLSADGVGIRYSSSPVVAGVMARVTFPVTATSANYSGRVTPPAVDLIAEALGDRVDLYLDGGPCRSLTPSTVVKVDGPPGQVTVLRHGQIAEAEIRRFLKSEEADG